MDIAQIRPKDKVAGGSPSYELTENDQVFPAGMYRIIATGDTLDFQRATAVDWSSATSMLTLDGGNSKVTLGVTTGFGDDVIFTLGDDSDIAIVLRSTILAADTVLANVLEGSVESQAIAANSLMLANITDDGDIAMYVSKGGNSQMVFWADGSSGDTAILAASGQSVDIYIGGSKVIDITNNGTKTTLTGLSGDYFQIGDVSVNTSQGFNSENDLLVVGKLEVNGNIHGEGSILCSVTLDALFELRCRDDVAFYQGVGQDSVLRYESADADAKSLHWALPHVDEDANNVACLVLMDRDADGSDLGAGGVDLSGITKPTLAIGNEASGAYGKFDCDSLYLLEKATADADVPGLGQFWVKDDAPNKPYFTNDEGDDHELALFDVDTGEMIVISNQTAVIETANTPHAFTGFSTGDLNDFSFVAGITGAITAYADYSGTVADAIKATSVGHGLVTNDIITIRGTAGPNDYNGIWQITRIDDDNFYFVEAALWNADAGASDFEMGDYLLAGAGTAGEYDLSWSSSVSEGGGAGSVILFCPMQNTTILTKASSKRKFANNDVGAMPGGGHITIAVADRIWFTHQSDGTNDLTVNLMNLRLSRLA